jgi:hypothetical protein
VLSLLQLCVAETMLSTTTPLALVELLVIDAFDRSTLPLSRGVDGFMYTCRRPRSSMGQWKEAWNSAPLLAWIS